MAIILNDWSLIIILLITKTVGIDLGPESTDLWLYVTQLYHSILKSTLKYKNKFYNI
jgi:hypothetical protein